MRKQRRFAPAGKLLLAALGCVAVDNIYALFGHGVRSAAMSLMFLYPLGGSCFYALLAMLRPGRLEGGGGRLGRNLLNSGIAALAVGSLLTGILEIAGSSSPYPPWFAGIGWCFAAAGCVLLLLPGGPGSG